MDLVSLSFETLSLLFAAAMVAGTIDTIAGGGGLITLPALLLAGLNPLAALATSKVQAIIGVATASAMMLKNKRIKLSDMKPFLLNAFVGAALGTIIVQFIDTSALKIIIPIVLFFIGFYFLLAPWINKIEAVKNAKVQSDSSYKKTTLPLIGFYDGVFGPGTGSFFTLAGVSLRKLPILDAIAQAKILNFTTNLSSILIFAFSGKVIWTAGIVMMSGQMIGAWIGSHILLRINPEYVRWMVITVCFTVLVKYLLDNF